MYISKKVLVIGVILLVVVGAVVSIGLYTTLKKFSPSDSGEYVTAPPSSRAVQQPVVTFPNSPRPNVRPAVPYTGPGGEQAPMTPGMSPDMAPLMNRPERSPEFKEARKKIMREGVEPDWNLFQGEELDAMQRVWKRYQRRQERMEQRGGDGQGKGMRQRPGRQQQPLQPAPQQPPQPQ